ncbi:zinc-dependent alcohol dehydrogenase [Neokomagataea thailandica NBRC 106555]|uniref:Zinc-type alcohol dehydrogenase-like protein n=2 Tax=Neokomagataea TaxID=1223423 RepID=A0A4Y6VAD5_9PROT|nr:MULTISPECIES: zinc-binding alcohol dehydrogenase family protein [Neokomagataea]QDH25531.1 zinc-binding alcohol dehydrogenase family protein [Neokomagataea tanensis]GBR55645.1 zinc-dependent alcohol dehydrogenase [Neokomagataea thailandica NBRC 106555]
MKAFGHSRASSLTDDNALIEIQAPTPEPQPHDVIVEIAAVSINPVDTKLRQSALPTSDAVRILGYDACGTVVATGGNVSKFRSGDRVFYAGSAIRPGSNAEYQAVDERIIAHAPKTLNVSEAAALPLTAITAWELLFDRLRVPLNNQFTDDTILIIGGAGGVGSILIQLARRLTGLRVVATASRPETIAWCEKMGAHHIIDHTRPLSQELKRLGIPHVRYVASLTQTAQHRDEILQVLAPQGALALIDDPGSFDIMPFKRKSLSVHWEFMFTRPIFETPDMSAQGHILSQVASLVDAGLIQTTLYHLNGAITLQNLLKAHALQESGKSIGKTVLTGF